MRYELGLVSVSFRQHTPEEILTAMQEAGLTCIEWGSDIHAPKENREKLERLAASQKQYGIRCCSYGTYFRLGVTALGELEDYIAGAKILGTDILRLWCGDRDSEDYTGKEREELFRVCREAAEIAERHGVTLCMECHNKTFTNRKEAALALMEAVGSPYFRMYWQPNQYRGIEENLAYAEVLAPYTRYVHVFNWRGKEKMPLGEAILLWQGYLRCFDRDRCLLLEFMPDGKLETLGREAEALRCIAEGVYESDILM